MSEPALPAAGPAPVLRAGTASLPARGAGTASSPVSGAGAPARGAPVRPAATRSRSGGAMARTRTTILAAAAGLVERQGVRRTTMGEVAAASGVAKATLYNHFRTKDDVLGALVEDEVRRLAADAAAAASLEDALAAAALGLSTHGALRRVAAEEPTVLGALLRASGAPVWDQARSGTAGVLARAGLAGDDVQVGAVLRWLLGHALVPATREESGRGARVLAAGLRACPDGDAPPSPAGSAPAAAAPTAPAATSVEVPDPAAPPAVAAPELSGTVEEPDADRDAG